MKIRYKLSLAVYALALLLSACFWQPSSAHARKKMTAWSSIWQGANTC
ncbi:hypothetical protein ACFL6U_04465 [Planctomycetota bacterium]